MGTNGPTIGKLPYALNEAQVEACKAKHCPYLDMGNEAPGIIDATCLKGYISNQDCDGLAGAVDYTKGD